jgi:hypothetical protein
MGVTKRIICLANSRKWQGRCIAGIEARADQCVWIRPVSDRPDGEVSEYERQYQDGSDPRLLDLIDVPLIEPRPKTFQNENWLLDPTEYWIRVGRIEWGDLERIKSASDVLWLNGSSTYNGLNDQILLEQADQLTSSLELISIDRLRLKVFKPGEAFGNSKRRVQGWFAFKGINYGLWVTDPTVEREYLARADGDYMVGPCYLTISLGEPYKGYCYKLIAAVISLS